VAEIALQKILLPADLQKVMPVYKIDEHAEWQAREQRKDCSKRLCRLRLHMKRAQMQAIDRQESRDEKSQERPVKITLRLIRGGRREASFPASAPRQRNRQHDGETFPQRITGHQKVELAVLQENWNPMDRHMQTAA